ncbi:hypothetical protein BDQ12DRAFT_307612 [Crucibulum laeve]|uniref:Uncharacterized protein n=1 Tax=Crucibulum laeve TaxID=68775 RepID=A0A5C3LV03_9AGAR|nr:hypothetical protein BDQ12DRAFT_307612 [Crucibulum laeve]
MCQVILFLLIEKEYVDNALDLVVENSTISSCNLFLESGETFSLQVGTEFSFLIASSSYSTSSCSQTGGKVYHPSNSTPTNTQFSFQYLQGAISGPSPSIFHRS